MDLPHIENLIKKDLSKHDGESFEDICDVIRALSDVLFAQHNDDFNAVNEWIGAQVKEKTPLGEELEVLGDLHQAAARKKAESLIKNLWEQSKGKITGSAPQGGLRVLRVHVIPLAPERPDDDEAKTTFTTPPTNTKQ